MKVIDTNGNYLKDYNQFKGWLDYKQSIRHIDARDYIQQQGHYEIIKEYENGGKDIRWIVDEPEQEACQEHDEVDEYAVFVPYTEEQLEQVEWAKPFLTNNRVTKLQNANDTLVECILEMSKQVYNIDVQTELSRMTCKIEQLIERNKELQQRNDMLTECILQLSQIVYGGDSDVG